MGDLIVTCWSRHGRNRRAGELIARGATPGRGGGGDRQPVEGLTTAPVLRDLSHRLGVELPITEGVCAVLDGRDLSELAAGLMGRQPTRGVDALRLALRRTRRSLRSSPRSRSSRPAAAAARRPASSTRRPARRDSSAPARSSSSRSTPTPASSQWKQLDDARSTEVPGARQARRREIEQELARAGTSTTRRRQARARPRGRRRGRSDLGATNASVVVAHAAEGRGRVRGARRRRTRRLRQADGLREVGRLVRVSRHARPRSTAFSGARRAATLADDARSRTRWPSCPTRRSRKVYVNGDRARAALARRQPQPRRARPYGSAAGSSEARRRPPPRSAPRTTASSCDGVAQAGGLDVGGSYALGLLAEAPGGRVSSLSRSDGSASAQTRARPRARSSSRSARRSSSALGVTLDDVAAAASTDEGALYVRAGPPIPEVTLVVDSRTTRRRPSRRSTRSRELGALLGSQRGDHGQQARSADDSSVGRAAHAPLRRVVDGKLVDHDTPRRGIADAGVGGDEARRRRRLQGRRRAAAGMPDDDERLRLRRPQGRGPARRGLRRRIAADRPPQRDARTCEPLRSRRSRRRVARLRATRRDRSTAFAASYRVACAAEWLRAASSSRPSRSPRAIPTRSPTRSRTPSSTPCSRDDPMGRVACETLITTGLVVVAGEITTETYVDIPTLVRETDRGDRLHARQVRLRRATRAASIVAIDEQSPDIAQGVDDVVRGAARARRRRPARPGRRGRPGDDVRLRDATRRRS